ncbi:MAG: DUF4976 domain-containing protein [Spirochaetaceae bacterium]|nr:MAG: DUF4976 domain-containing protein [Spirochaetaceae bacterium]
MARAHDRPNILWYCTDQQRWDTIHGLGNEFIHTPNLDRFLEQGVAFERAYCQAPICTPSRASFLTGRYPASTHVHRNGNDTFPANEKLVTKILADAGYDCALAGKLHLSRAKGRVERRPDDGYRVFHWSHHPQPDWPEGHGYARWLSEEKGVDPEKLFSEYADKPYGVPAELHQTTWCTEMALRFVDEKRDGPWLLSLNPFDPHPPFDAPKEYLDRYEPSTLPLPLFAPHDIERQRAFAEIDQQTRVAVDPREPAHDATPSGRSEAGVDRASQPPESYDARFIKANYYAMIELVDAEFGRLLAELDRRGELENTIVIFMSDHGELLGDHGLLYKGCRFFESLVHVPLIVSWPGRFARNVRSSALVELVDIAPTLLDAVGLPVPPSMQGRSLVPILTGEADPSFHKPHVFSEYWDAVVVPQGPTHHSHATMRFDGRYKSIVYHGCNLGEIYDLENDPGEFENLWDHSGSTDLKTRVLLEHLDALAACGWAGPQRTAAY